MRILCACKDLGIATVAAKLAPTMPAVPAEPLDVAGAEFV